MTTFFLLLQQCAKKLPKLSLYTDYKNVVAAAVLFPNLQYMYVRFKPNNLKMQNNAMKVMILMQLDII